MSIIVQKFGGSSVATNEHVGAVADRILAARRDGHDVVVTVSAMGDTTSDLLEQAGAIAEAPPPRELDALLSTGERVSASLLSMALNQRGAPAASLDGRQAGVRTDDRHFNAAIESVDATRIRAELDAGRIPVVTGYQGRTSGGDITTLGLGGSDTTAVALASALGAQRCDICTDVDGVYSADPRIVSDAYRLDELGYTEMAVLARHGAGVLNPQSVEYARRHSVRLRVCSTFQPQRPGTLIRDVSASEVGPRAVGIASHDALVPIAIDGASGLLEGTGDRVRELLGSGGVVMDHTETGGQRRHILVDADVIADRDDFGRRVDDEFGSSVTVGSERGSVSAVGLDVGSDEQLARESRRDTERAGIPLYGYFRSDHAQICVLYAQAVPRAMQLFHQHLEPTREVA